MSGASGSAPAWVSGSRSPITMVRDTTTSAAASPGESRHRRPACRVPIVEAMRRSAGIAVAPAKTVRRAVFRVPATVKAGAAIARAQSLW